MEMDKKAYYYLGLGYASLKLHGKAIDAFQAALNLDSDFLEAYIGLGYGYIVVKNWKRGIELLNRAVILAPQNPEVHFLLSFMHLGNDDLDSAEHEYELLKDIKKVLRKTRLSKKNKESEYAKIAKYLSELDKAIRQYKNSRKYRYR
jgi:tetratricopeptide (TPR) repeat protein